MSSLWYELAVFMFEMLSFSKLDILQAN